MLEPFSKQIIWKLKRQSPIAGSELRNRWEEFCWHYQGDSTELALWEDAIALSISNDLNKLAKTEKLTLLLNFNYDIDGCIDAVFSLIKSAAVDYLFADD